MRRFREQLKDASVDFTVELGHAHLLSGDLLDLRVGDVLTLDKDVNEVLVAMIEGVPKFRGRAGMYRGNRAFKVESYL
jgi:flagellar motor switch protein FliM